MQAITVLLLELAQGAIHRPTDPSNITTCVEKLIRWLKAMASNDVVSERAYNTVRKMLDRHEQSSEDVTTGPWVEETTDQPYNEPTTASDMASQPYNDPDLQYFQETSCLHTYFDDDCYSRANSGNFNLNSLAWPLDQPPADFLFGQEQIPLSFGNYFSTNFDQGTDYYGLGGYTQYGQQPPP
jgi:hypothetical protein